MDLTGRRAPQLIVSLASGGQLAEAAARASEISDARQAIDAWTFLYRANANLQRWNEARFALENALRFAPESPSIGLELALLHERLGHHEESLARFEALCAAHPGSAELLGHCARGLAFAGHEDRAARLLEDAVARWPADARLHRQLADLRWRLGAGDQTTAPVERALASHPDSLPLRLVAAESLRNAGHTSRALDVLDAGLARDPHSPGLLSSSGALLAELGRDEDALRRLRRAHALAPQSPSVQRNLVPVLLRAGAAREALALLDRLIGAAPDDQLLMAWRATALRIAGDARYETLVDYPRLVQVSELAPTPEFADLAAFNERFASELAALHRSHPRPLGQSLRGGTQTERNLPADDPARYPAIAAFFVMLDAPIRRYLSRLDASRDHPTDRRCGAGYRIAGSWSVRLQSGGFHCSHVHPQGWISSAYYVSVPRGADAGREGWLHFGEPGMSRPVCPPDLFIEPRPGRLVLFPSFLWHGTVPFAANGERLTAAFDVVPA